MNKNFLKLIKLLVFKNIRQEKFLTVLSVIGVALGIGLFVGVKVASDRAISSFESDIKGISPLANYEVFDISGIDFDERIFNDIRNLEENSFPVLKTFGYVPELKETIDLNGIYTIRNLDFLASSRDRRIDIEKFFRMLNGVLITKDFAKKYSLTKGDTFRPLIYDREYALKVVEVIESKSLLMNSVVMDIGNFQEFFGKEGHLTRIDIKTDEKTAGEIHAVLPSNLRIEKKEEIIRNQKGLIASFRYNLQFVSLIAILVGIYLLYNTVFISVVKRRAEIGILRSLGADKKTIVMLFTLQGLILGLVGSFLGIFLGQAAAYFSVIAVEKTLSTMYTTIPISDYLISGRDAIIAFILGACVSLVASAVPSYEASKIRPNETAREGSFEGRYKGYQKIFTLSGVAFIFAGTVSSYLDYVYLPLEFPVLAYLGILFIICGFTLLSPFYLLIFLRVIRRTLEKMFGAIGKITAGDMNGNVYRFSIALMSVAISSALIIALFILIFSLRGSVKGWINQYIVADVYIKPASCKSNYCFYPMSEDVVQIVESYPEIAGVDKFRALHLDFFGRKVIAGFADIKVKRKYSRKMYFEKEYDETLGEMEGEEKVAGISEYLSTKYGLEEGDIIELETPAGKAAFRINDVSSSYSTTSGFVYIDRKWLKRLWGLDDTTQFSAYVKEGVNVNQFIRKLKDRLLAHYSLEIMDNQELRQKIMDIFNKSFAITYAIELISIIVSLIGVINTLLAFVFERKREISIFRYLGGSWDQIRQNLILSAGIVGITGIVLGSLLGPLMSVIFMNVVNKISFGWEIHFKMPFFYLSVVMIVLFLTTLWAGILPGKVARKIDPKRFISFE
ncbi:MAG: FtsX-like permease family protein [Nitrospirota bacterium]